MLSQNVRTFHYLNTSLPFPNIIYSIHTYKIENFNIEMFKCLIKKLPAVNYGSTVICGIQVKWSFYFISSAHTVLIF